MNRMPEKEDSRENRVTTIRFSDVERMENIFKCAYALANACVRPRQLFSLAFFGISFCSAFIVTNVCSVDAIFFQHPSRCRQTISDMSAKFIHACRTICHLSELIRLSSLRWNNFPFIFIFCFHFLHFDFRCVRHFTQSNENCRKQYQYNSLTSWELIFVFRLHDVSDLGLNKRRY